MKAQLYEKNCHSGQSNPLYPVTTLEQVRDQESGKTLDQILQECNHIYLPFKGNSKALTRQQIPAKLRRRGLWITYISCAGKTTTEWYNSSNYSDKAWGDNNNWVKYSDLDAVKEMLSEVVTWYKA